MKIDENGMDEYRWICPNVKGGFKENIFFREEPTTIEDREEYKTADGPIQTNSDTSN